MREDYRTEEGIIQLSHRMFEQGFERTVVLQAGHTGRGEYKKEKKKGSK